MSGYISDCCDATAIISLHRRWRRDIYRCTRCLRICGVNLLRGTG